MAKRLNEIEKKASSKALGDLRQHMQSMMGDKMKGVKKVTIASDSKEGLEEGLSVAEKVLKAKGASDVPTKSPKSEIFGKSIKEEMSDENPEEIETISETSPEESDEEESEMEDCDTPEKIDAKIDELMKMKAQMMKR